MSFNYEKDYEDFTKAMKAALRGPSVKEISIDGHGFNVKTVQVTGNAQKVLVVNGEEGRHISHRITFNDDQIYYKVTIDSTNYNPEDPNSAPAIRFDLWDIDAGGIIDSIVDGVKYVTKFCKDNPELCASAAKAVKGAAAVYSPYNEYSGLIGQHEHLLDGSWTGAAEFLITCITYLAVVESRSGTVVVG